MKSVSSRSCRHAFTGALLRAARRDASLFAVTSDARGSVTLGEFAESLPGQFVEVGIAEQNAVGIAAGLSRTGKRVFVCGPACFYSARSLEQVKIDVAYAHTDVKIIGVSGGVSYGALGSTHHSLHDIAVMRTFPGMELFLPSDFRQTELLTGYLAQNSGPAYVRPGRGAVPRIYDEATLPEVKPGKAITVRPGNDAVIIAAGETVWPALQAAEQLAIRGIECRVLDCWSIRPFDTDAVIAAAVETGAVVTMEEHSIFGGLGAAVAETVSRHCPVPMRLLGFPDAWAPAGSSAELFAWAGIDAAGAVRAVETLREV